MGEQNMKTNQIVEKNTTRVKYHEINLEPLYKYGVQFNDEDLLNTILSLYEKIEYRLLYVASPDIDVVYLDKEFWNYADKCFEKKEDNEDTEEEDIVLSCAKRFAEENGFEMIIKLYDGYEEAVAAVKKKDVDEE